MLDITEEQRRDLRSWYERPMAYFRILSIHEPLMDVQNMLNEQPYTIRAEHLGDTFRVGQIVFGSLVPWGNEWCWSGILHTIHDVTDKAMQQAKQDFAQRMPQIIYRYCHELAETARAMTRKDYQEFVAYFGDDLVTFPDGYRMAEAMKKLYEQRFETAPKEAVEAFLTKHNLAKPSPNISYPPALLESTDGIGVYFSPEEGVESMMHFHDVTSGFKQKGRDVTESERKRLPNDVKKQVEDIVARFNTTELPDPHCRYVPRYRGKFLYLDREDYGRISGDVSGIIA
jgi:hypothetical protein